MLVLKFGGTSLGNPSRMKQVAELILSGDDKKWVVLSAVSGTTNSLYEIVESIKKSDYQKAVEQAEALQKFYKEYIHQLLDHEGFRNTAWKEVEFCFNTIRSLINNPYSTQIEKAVVAQGELISTQLFTQLLEEMGVNAKLVSALVYMRTNRQGEPDMAITKQNLQTIEKDTKGFKIVVTQGFICRNHLGEIDNLKRGGSDFSASILGACLGSEEVQIWTDIDGMHNNDPRIVKQTRPISKLTFDEAAELAYFGAKVLHPSTILPARLHNIPVRIKNTLNAGAEGTVISKAEPGWSGGVKAVAAKDGISAIKIRSSRMLMAYGFLRQIFEIFENFETPIDMITTSEVAVSLTIDNISQLDQLIPALESFGEVEVDHDMTIICIVGNGIAEDKGTVSKIFHSLDSIQVRMISYGGSRNNISILVKSSLKQQALEELNQGLFGL